MTLNTLHTYRTITKFCVDKHFIYITACRYESKEELHLYYKLTDEDMEEITKEWSSEFIVPIKQTDFSNPDIIGSPVVTREEYDGPNSSKKNKKKEEVQEINNASEENAFDSPRGVGGDEVNQEGEGEEDKKEKGKVTDPESDPGA
jgi:hypothetical protein